MHHTPPQIGEMSHKSRITSEIGEFIQPITISGNSKYSSYLTEKLLISVNTKILGLSMSCTI